MVWAWCPAGQLGRMQARAISFGTATGRCDLCGVEVRGGVASCPACMASLRLLRALALRGSLLPRAQREVVARM
eukprot:1682719-Alexandrium_andersonii.AAC.1